MSSNCTTASLFKAEAARFGLRTQCDTVLSFVNLVVHLTCLVPAIDIETRRIGDHLVVRVVMLHVHGVSTHRGLRLTLHLSIELIELIVLLLLLLMISTDM